MYRTLQPTLWEATHPSAWMIFRNPSSSRGRYTGFATSRQRRWRNWWPTTDPHHYQEPVFLLPMSPTATLLPTPSIPSLPNTVLFLVTSQIPWPLTPLTQSEVGCHSFSPMLRHISSLFHLQLPGRCPLVSHPLTLGNTEWTNTDSELLQCII